MLRTLRQCAGDVQMGISPMNFKEMLLGAATSDIRDNKESKDSEKSKVHLVHTSRTLNDVYVASSVVLKVREKKSIDGKEEEKSPLVSLSVTTQSSQTRRPSIPGEQYPNVEKMHYFIIIRV